MNGTPTLQRNSPLMLAVRLAESTAVIVPTVFAWLTIRTRWPTWFGVSIDAIMLAIAVLAVAGLVFEWWFTRFSSDAGGIIYRKGLLMRRAISLGWDEVVSIQVSRSPVARFLGCSKVIIGVGSTSRSKLVIDAVAPHTATELETSFTQSRARGHATKGREVPGTRLETGSLPLTQGVSAKENPPEETLLYRIRSRDFLVLSVTYGQFVLVVPFLLGAYGNVADVFSLSAIPFTLPDIDLPLPLFVLVILLAAAPAAVLFGVAIAWLRFRQFEVHQREDGYAMTGGLLTDESRQVSRSQVAGLKVQQNPVMRVTGFARLRFVSRQTGDRIASNILFPAVRLSSIRTSLVSHFPRYVTALYRPARIPSQTGWALMFIDVFILALVGALIRDMPAFLAASLMLATAIALLVATNYGWATITIDADGLIDYRRGFIWVTHYLLPEESVYVAESYSVSLLGGRSMGLMCLGVYDSRPVRLWVPVNSLLTMDKISGASTANSHYRNGQVP